jgi:hypothetical protein
MPTNKVEKIQQVDIAKPSNVEPTSANNSSKEINLFGPSCNAKEVTLSQGSGISLFNSVDDLKSSKPQNVNKSLVVDAELIDPIDSELLQKYSAQDAKAFRGLSAEQIKFAKQLAQTKLSADDIAEIAKNFSEAQVKKITSNAVDMEKTCGGNNLKKIFLVPDTYEEGSFNLVAKQKDGVLIKELFDKDINRQTIEKKEEYQTEDGNFYLEKEANDLRTNTYSKVRYAVDPSTGEYYVTHEIRSKMGEDGNMVSREYTKPSEIKGVFDIEVLHQDGELEKVSSTKFDEKTGATKVNKNMTSLDGTKTHYVYSDNPNGDRELKYKITDKDGKVLMDEHRSFEVISENHFSSTSNGKKYDMVVAENSLTVKDMANPAKTVTLDFGKIQGDKDKIISVLKQMSGEELMALSQTTKSLEGVENVLADSYYRRADKSIHAGDDLFIFLHELGHAKDLEKLDFSSKEKLSSSVDDLISSDAELNKIYNQERDAFNKAFPDAQREHVDFFINKTSHYNGSDAGLRETIAETNALEETPKAYPMFAIRSQYLQQYFPRTIAYISEQL